MTAHCTKYVTHSQVKVEENKRKAVFRNVSGDEYAISKIDNCIVTSGIRTDYLVSKVGSASVLVELKGRNVEHACDQLFASAGHGDVKPLLEANLGFLIVCSKFPRFDTYVLKAKSRAAKDFKAGFHVVCDKGNFDIEKVCSISGK